MAKEPEDEEGGEFADFLADVSKEVADAVELLGPANVPAEEPEPKKTPVVAAERKKTPATTDSGIIVEWPNIADRLIEEVR